ncbi:MAG: hypothetical protein Q4D50_08865 [Eubacteriales bacterium]|nr:hypothetical protein [Eubacteriales bacterium]
MRETGKKDWIYGIAGCICFGIGDWLLGYVDPALIEGDIFYFIRAGHGAGYNAAKVTVTLVLAMVGMLFYFPAMLRIADLASDKKSAGRLKYTFGLCPVGWLVIHFIVAVNVLVYSWMAEHAGNELANGISNLLGNAILPCLMIAYIFAGIPLLLLMIYILRGKTGLKKWEAVFTPLVWMAVINVVANILPATAFSYGLYTFCMNCGMLVWFLYLLVKHPR